jgi:hypothetical protein
MYPFLSTSIILTPIISKDQGAPALSGFYILLEAISKIEK